jgi:hypothetical protein
MDPAKELQIKIGTTADVAGAEQAERSLEGVAQAGAAAGKGSKVAADQFDFLGKAGAQAAAGSTDAAKALSDLKNAGTGASQVLNGVRVAAQGGISGIFGMAQAVRGLITVVRAGVVSSGPIGLLVIALGTLAGLFLALTGRSKETSDALENTGNASDRLKKKLGELEISAKQSLKEQIERVEQLTSSYDDLIARVTAAEERMRASIKLQTDLKSAQIDRDEQRALAGATSAEQREAISRQFGAQRQTFQASVAAAELETRELQAKLQLQQAQAQLAGLQREKDQSAAGVAAARSAAEETAARAKAATKDAMTTSGILGGKSTGAIEALPFVGKSGAELRREDPEVLRRFAVAKDETSAAIAAAAALKEAEEAAARIAVKLADGLARVDAQISEAQADIERAIAGRQILATTTETGALKATAEAKPKIAAARTAAEEAAARGDSAGQDKAVAELKALTTEINRRDKQAGEQIAGLLKDNFAMRAAKDEVIVRVIEKANRRELNSREP